MTGNREASAQIDEEWVIATRGKSLPPPEQLLQLVRTTLEDDKAEDVIVIDLGNKSSIADYMVIATGRSHRQVDAMAEHLLRACKGAGMGRVPVEGRQQCDWVLVDAGDVVVHLFRPEVRSFYNLEKMWGLAMPESDRDGELIA